jgi:hypothetical protein
MAAAELYQRQVPHLHGHLRLQMHRPLRTRCTASPCTVCASTSLARPATGGSQSSLDLVPAHPVSCMASLQCLQEAPPPVIAPPGQQSSPRVHNEMKCTGPAPPPPLPQTNALTQPPPLAARPHTAHSLPPSAHAPLRRADQGLREPALQPRPRLLPAEPAPIPAHAGLGVHLAAAAQQGQVSGLVGAGNVAGLCRRTVSPGHRVVSSRAPQLRQATAMRAAARSEAPQPPFSPLTHKQRECGASPGCTRPALGAGGIHLASRSRRRRRSGRRRSWRSWWRCRWRTTPCCSTACCWRWH